MEEDTVVDIMEVIMEADIMVEDTTEAGENKFQQPHQLRTQCQFKYNIFHFHVMKNKFQISLILLLVLHIYIYI